MLSYLVLVYAVCSIGLLLAYQRTRLFPLYMLKCTWAGFTILAFLWVVAMSFGQNNEYIQRPAGPFTILVGEPVAGSTLPIGGYAATLWQYTGTRPEWVIAALFVAWITWGLMRADRHTIENRVRVNDGAARPVPVIPLEVLDYGRAAEKKFPSYLFPIIAAVVIDLLLLRGCGWRDAFAFTVVMGLWFALPFFANELFTRHGHWMLIGLLLILALPIVVPLSHFDWSRYKYGKENYSYAWSEGHIGQYFVNSLMVTITTVAITTLVGAMAAYIMARREFAGRKLLYGVIIGAITIPGILIEVPLFLLIKDWGFTIHASQAYRYSFMDSRLGLAIIYTAISLPFTIFVLTGFFRTLPGTLGEAAVIDGCSQWKTFTDIYLPLALPGIATTGIFNFLGAWNEFNLGMIFMSNPNFKTLPIGLYELQVATEYTSAWAPMFAGIVLLCLPTFLIFVFLQERIVAGLTAGGLKG